MSVPHLSETSCIKLSPFILPFTTLLFTLIVVDRPQAIVVDILQHKLTPDTSKQVFVSRHD